jgi:hypothetical protein
MKEEMEMSEVEALKHDLERVMTRENRFLNALVKIAEITERRQLPITAQINDIATEALS